MNRRSSPLPPLTGAPGLTQGAYGDRGNLELVAPGAAGGLWVFWFNADEVDHHQGAVRGCWSGGLHFFAGRDVTLARITQVSAGPNFLEVVALTASGDLHRLYWTPSDGFVEAGVIVSGARGAAAIVQTADTLGVSVLLADGSLRLLKARLDDYPSLAWSEPLPAPESAALAVRTDVAVVGDLVLGLDLVDVPVRAITAAATTLDGGRIDVVLADDDGLLHLHGDGATWTPPVRITSEVWTP
jgi:hypothetical protein